MTNIEFVEKLHKAVNSKTLYVLGCFGAPLNASNKTRYTNNYASNRAEPRKTDIMNASFDTFGFDCVCLVKGILWGWNGDTTKTYGGADYASNGVPDTGIATMLKTYCTDQSKDFSNIEVGEFLVMDGHCGVYIGDGMAIESTPKWKNGVQITEVWNIKKTSSVGRNWVSHGKLKAVEYIKEQPVSKDAEVLVIFPNTVGDDEVSATKAKLETLGYAVRVLTEGR